MQRILKLFPVLFLFLTASQCTPIRTAIHNETGSDVYLRVSFNVRKPDAFGPLERGAQLNLTEASEQISLITYRYGSTICRLEPAEIRGSIVGTEYDMIRIDLKPCRALDGAGALKNQAVRNTSSRPRPS
jgi:hypothetical protein